MKIFSFTLAAFALTITHSLSAPTQRRPITIYLAGDSTMAQKLPAKRPETGWGEMLKDDAKACAAGALSNKLAVPASNSRRPRTGPVAVSGSNSFSTRWPSALAAAATLPRVYIAFLFICTV